MTDAPTPVPDPEFELTPVMPRHEDFLALALQFDEAIADCPDNQWENERVALAIATARAQWAPLALVAEAILAIYNSVSIPGADFEAQVRARFIPIIIEEPVEDDEVVEP